MSKTARQLPVKTARNRFSVIRTSKKLSLFDPEALEKDEKLKKRNIRFYEKLLNIRKKRKSSAEADGSNPDFSAVSIEDLEIQDLIEENGGFYFM